MRQKFLVLAKVSKKNPGLLKPIYIRVSDGVAHDWKVRTPFVVDPAAWDADKQEAIINPKMSKFDRETYEKLNKKLSQLRDFINQKFIRDKNFHSVGSDWLEESLAEFFCKKHKTSKSLEQYSLLKSYFDRIIRAWGHPSALKVLSLYDQYELYQNKDEFHSTVSQIEKEIQTLEMEDQQLHQLLEMLPE